MNKSNIDECVPVGLRLLNFQYDGINFLVERSRALIASDAGTGKTVMLITAVNTLTKEKNLNVLVLCPKSMILTWKKEICKWSLEWNSWAVLNYDKLVAKKLSPELTRTWDIIIADESHQCIKNPKSKRGDVFLKKLIPNSKRVWLSTATPASKSGLDYYSTLKVLLPGVMKTWSARQFEKEFCNPVRDRFAYGGYRYEGFANTATLKELFKVCCIRHKKEDVLSDLPPKIYTNIEVELPKDVIAEHLEIDTALVIECMETGRPLPGHIAHVMQATAMAKLEVAVDLIKNFPEDKSLVVFAWHRSIVHALREKLLCLKPVVITGELTDIDKRQEIIDGFQSGKYRILICNMLSGGTGLTLTKADTALYIEFPHSPIHLYQSENRIHRIGSEGSVVNIIRLIGHKSVDETIFKALDARIKKIEEVGV